MQCERIINWSFRSGLAIAAIEQAVHWQPKHANHLLILLTFFGLEALNENADWLVQSRRKPVVLPK